MTEYGEILKKLEEATKLISDESLRRIAFERLLEHELSGAKTPDKKLISKDESEERPSRAKRSKASRPAGDTASNIREEVKALQIFPDEEGLPPWNSLGALDKYLWMLEAAQKKKIDGLSCVEISSLIYDVFKENHQQEQVANLRTRIKRGHVRATKISCGDKKFAGYQILRGGTDQLKGLASERAKA
jgi:hypothetical protein